MPLDDLAVLAGRAFPSEGRADRERLLAMAPRRVTLVRLSGEIARSMAAIGRIAVEGEVHRPQTFPSGRTYFVLRDRAAQVPVACPARHARRCRAVAGERVVVVGTLVWGNERGQLVLEAEEVTPVGEGAVAAMIAETRSRLAADGLLNRPGRPLPRLPRVIGVLCGADAAVRKDIESVVAARFPGYPLAVEETTVTGPGAAQAIVEALWRLCRRQPRSKWWCWPAAAGTPPRCCPGATRTCAGRWPLARCRWCRPSATSRTGLCATRWPTCAAGRRR